MCLVRRCDAVYPESTRKRVLTMHAPLKVGLWNRKQTRRVMHGTI
jgi:hypothetical protein